MHSYVCTYIYMYMCAMSLQLQFTSKLILMAVTLNVIVYVCTAENQCTFRYAELVLLRSGGGGFCCFSS